jgi:hypothetical protein
LCIIHIRAKPALNRILIRRQRIGGDLHPVSHAAGQVALNALA